MSGVDATETPRRNPFPALFNFRDVGGLTGHDGRRVRRGRLYRSDSLHRIDETDRAAFTALGIRTVIDLRRPTEVARDGRVPAYDGLTYRHIHPEHEDWATVPYAPEEDLARWLADRYAGLAQTGTAGLAEAVGLIADSANAPVVVHCVAGKDRTGVVCALTLAVLGVADADIAADYALSTVASERFSAWVAATLPEVAQPPRPYLASPAGAMTLFLDELRAGYGSAEGYLRHAGVTDTQLDALRAHLLD
ncbi:MULTISPECIES: tyrosine-protein phosphatase [Micromonospora]|uniref:Tyrosine-protein phosphatase n=1 Tax=Micromonospora solifontis TaxID=2487138 RepID=A0ABX9WK78_9ACTN|nr:MULTISPECIES: tyrosine-protein phosphatase [Micromonospora]NES14069.1 tyrosine-protein phosphatase [Micromonospora sp. PPF5-17B]NES35699.1 tyrosine-protein phosphatase [Micromonospora solifontis]NES56054.1 tyrosine-protein phosphatase [Micromonospora sp. PPF5-6]RNM00379.1 tyrosine-protein phosphatase [Micromonospora solifontis]